MTATPRRGAVRVPRTPALDPETIRRIEQATGALATKSVARMDEKLSWFRSLPADQRSWVSLVAQAGLQSFVSWLRTGDNVLRLTGEVFNAAPKAMARSVTLQQTVELVRQVIAVAEENLPALVAEADIAIVREEMLRFSREIAFAAARVYAGAAEARGSWDRRLEALVIDSLVRGAGLGQPLPSQLAALGWHLTGHVAAVVGNVPDLDNRTSLDHVHELARTLRLDAMAGIHASRLVIIAGDGGDAAAIARALLPAFGPGPVVYGPAAEDLSAASTATQAALAGLSAAAAWPAAPRPVSSEDLLAERALAGDESARRGLIETIYRPLADADPVLLETAGTFLDYGAGLEATARALYVHANTVRYRLRRISEVCGQAPNDPRGAFTLRVALALGRLTDATG